jgi:alkaline phosphatase D
MGYRVGEVTQNSAIVWTRITAQAEPNWQGETPNPKESPTRRMVTNKPIPVERWEGALPGAPGEVRLILSKQSDLRDATISPWSRVDADSDFTYQFHPSGLEPGTRYYLKVDARDGAAQAATPIGSFTTAATPDQWQDVHFAVTSCQMYYHRDLRDGFRIFPAMAKLNLHFQVPTGDSVYYDRDNPRGNTVDLCRLHWHRMYGLPRLVEFYRNVPVYFEKDDHDTFFDDCWREYEAPWIAPLTYDEGLKVYREQVPIGQDFYRTVRWGKGLQVWFVEVRDFRSPNTMPDGPEKSLWGTAQKEWLKRTLLASDATFKVLISPTAIVGPDNPGQKDNQADPVFAHEGNEFRQWTRQLRNFYNCNGDRHWQFMSTDPKTGLREFGCGAASDEHAIEGPGQNPAYHSFYRGNKGGFLTIAVTRAQGGVPTIAFRFHDVDGRVLYEFRDVAPDAGR